MSKIKTEPLINTEVEAYLNDKYDGVFLVVAGNDGFASSIINAKCITPDDKFAMIRAVCEFTADFLHTAVGAFDLNEKAIIECITDIIKNGRDQTSDEKQTIQ